MLVYQELRFDDVKYIYPLRNTLEGDGRKSKYARNSDNTEMGYTYVLTDHQNGGTPTGANLEDGVRENPD